MIGLVLGVPSYPISRWRMVNRWRAWTYRETPMAQATLIRLLATMPQGPKELR